MSGGQTKRCSRRDGRDQQRKHGNSAQQGQSCHWLGFMNSGHNRSYAKNESGHIERQDKKREQHATPAHGSAVAQRYMKA